MIRPGIFAVTLSLMVIAAPIMIAQSEVPMPQKTGAVNDYAAALGAESRASLQELVTGLAAGGDLKVTILYSRLDPYSNPGQFAESLWQFWELEAERSLLLLFVTEENAWRFAWKTSPDLSAAFSQDSIKEALLKAQSAVADRQVSQAAIRFLEKLTELFVATPVAPEVSTTTDPPLPDTESTQIGPLASTETPGGSAERFLAVSEGVWTFAAGVALALLLFLLIRAALRSSCPKCGGPLKRRQESSSYSLTSRRSAQRPRSRTVYYCPQCRFQRT